MAFKPEEFVVREPDPALFDMLIADIRFRVFMLKKSVVEIFRWLDTDGNGDFTYAELYDGFNRSLKCEFTVEQVKALHRFMAKMRLPGLRTD